MTFRGIGQSILHKSIRYTSVCLALSCTGVPADDTASKLAGHQQRSITTNLDSMPARMQATADKIENLPTPDGYQRTRTKPSSFGQYLRSVSLRTDNDTVFQYDGQPKYPQNVHYAILDIDVGKRDLQQCADAVMRLRGEYLFANKRYGEIHFNFLSDGKPRYYKDHAESQHSYKSFRKYMDYIFAYANTASLRQELKSVSLDQMQLGDVFIQRGAPYGHAVIVVDMAENSEGDKIFMLAQSYMPAQDIHILKNFNEPSLSPWYSVDFGVTLYTPEWSFYDSDLKRF